MLLGYRAYVYSVAHKNIPLNLLLFPCQICVSVSQKCRSSYSDHRSEAVKIQSIYTVSQKSTAPIFVIFNFIKC